MVWIRLIIFRFYFQTIYFFLCKNVIIKAPFARVHFLTLYMSSLSIIMVIFVAQCLLATGATKHFGCVGA